jgi:hypothetical protein
MLILSLTGSVLMIAGWCCLARTFNDLVAVWWQSVAKVTGAMIRSDENIFSSERIAASPACQGSWYPRADRGNDRLHRRRAERGLLGTLGLPVIGKEA